MIKVVRNTLMFVLGSNLLGHCDIFKVLSRESLRVLFSIARSRNDADATIRRANRRPGAACTA